MFLSCGAGSPNRRRLLPKSADLWYNVRMKLNAYAKVNLILNVLGKRPDGYHEVLMLMQAISLCDVVTVEARDPADRGPGEEGRLLRPADFEYGEKDLAWKAAVLMAETFAPQKLEGNAIRGVRILIEKHIPAAAGLAGGSADAASVMIGLAKLWDLMKGPDCFAANDPGASAAKNDALFALLAPLGAKLGSDVPFCIASQLGHTAAIASGRGTDLEFVPPTDCGVDLFFSDAVIPSKTASVYRELKPEDCSPVYDIRAFLAAQTLAEKRALMGNHLQAPAERLLARAGNSRKAGQNAPAGLMLCGAGPTYFTIGETGQFRTIL